MGISINNKDIIQMHLGIYNQCFFCRKASSGFWLCSPIMCIHHYAHGIFSPVMSRYKNEHDIALISHYKFL